MEYKSNLLAELKKIKDKKLRTSSTKKLINKRISNSYYDIESNYVSDNNFLDNLINPKVPVEKGPVDFTNSINEENKIILKIADRKHLSGLNVIENPIGLKDIVKQSNKDLQGSIKAMEASTKYFEYQKQLNDYNEKINEIHNTISPYSGPIKQKNKLSFDEQEKLKNYANEVSEMRSKLSEMSTDFNKTFASMPGSTNDGYNPFINQFNLLEQTTEFANNKMSNILDSTGNDKMKSSLYNIFQNILSDEQTQWNIDYTANEYDMKHIVETATNDMINYDPTKAKGREREFNPQEVDQIRMMERASLTAGAPGARDALGMSDRSNRMGTKTDIDDLYKRHRAAGLSMADAEKEAMAGTQVKDRQQSHTKNWYKLEAQKRYQRMTDIEKSQFDAQIISAGNRGNIALSKRDQTRQETLDKKERLKDAKKKRAAERAAEQEKNLTNITNEK